MKKRRGGGISPQTSYVNFFPALNVAGRSTMGRPFDAEKDCQICQRSISDSYNYLMRCSRCRNRYHHKCHDPPLDSAAVHLMNVRANALTRAGKRVKDLSDQEKKGTAFAWACSICKRGGGACQSVQGRPRTGVDSTGGGGLRPSSQGTSKRESTTKPGITIDLTRGPRPPPPRPHPSTTKALKVDSNGVVDLADSSSDSDVVALPSPPGRSTQQIQRRPAPPQRTTVSELGRRLGTIVLTDSDSSPSRPFDALTLSSSSADEADDANDGSEEAQAERRAPVMRRPVFPKEESSDSDVKAISPERAEIAHTLGRASPTMPRRRRARTTARMTAARREVIKVEDSSDDEREVEYVEHVGVGSKREIKEDEKDMKKPRFSPLLPRTPSPPPIEYTPDGTRIARLLLPLLPDDLPYHVPTPLPTLQPSTDVPPWKNPTWPPHVLLSLDPKPWARAPSSAPRGRKGQARYLNVAEMKRERLWVRGYDVRLGGRAGFRRERGVGRAGWVEVLEGWEDRGNWGKAKEPEVRQEKEGEEEEEEEEREVSIAPVWGRAKGKGKKRVVWEDEEDELEEDELGDDEEVMRSPSIEL